MEVGQGPNVGCSAKGKKKYESVMYRLLALVWAAGLVLRCTLRVIECWKNTEFFYRPLSITQ
jgi:hypothetical protein